MCQKVKPSVTKCFNSIRNEHWHSARNIFKIDPTGAGKRLIYALEVMRIA